MVDLERERKDEGLLLHAGVCLRVPFNRVTVNRAKRDTSGHVDIAGVRSVVPWNEGVEGVDQHFLKSTRNAHVHTLASH